MSCDENEKQEGQVTKAPIIGRTKDQGGELEVVGRFSFQVEGISDKDKALTMLLDTLKPNAFAAALSIANGADGIKSKGDVHTLSGRICCIYSKDAYYWCPDGGVCCCNYIGSGCPA